MHVYFRIIIFGFFLDIHPEVELLGHMVVVFLVLDDFFTWENYLQVYKHFLFSPSCELLSLLWIPSPLSIPFLTSEWYVYKPPSSGYLLSLIPLWGSCMFIIKIVSFLLLICLLLQGVLSQEPRGVERNYFSSPTLRAKYEMFIIEPPNNSFKASSKLLLL